MLVLACDVPTTCLWCSTLLSQLAVADSTDTFACYFVNASPRLPLILLLGMGVIACCSCLILLTVVSAARHCCLLQVNNTVLLLHAHNVLGGPEAADTPQCCMLAALSVHAQYFVMLLPVASYSDCCCVLPLVLLIYTPSRSV